MDKRQRLGEIAESCNFVRKAVALDILRRIHAATCGNKILNSMIPGGA